MKNQKNKMNPKAAAAYHRCGGDVKPQIEAERKALIAVDFRTCLCNIAKFGLIEAKKKDSSINNDEWDDAQSVADILTPKNQDLSKVQAIIASSKRGTSMPENITDAQKNQAETVINILAKYFVS